VLVTKKGFTLIETLVALFIIAILLATAIKAIGIATSSIRDNYIKEIAAWIASNTYYKMKADKTYPALGETSQVITEANVNFIVTVTTIETGNSYFRNSQISVATQDQPNYVLFKTINFFSQY